jgi:hypothetical protein
MIFWRTNWAAEERDLRVAVEQSTDPAWSAKQIHAKNTGSRFFACFAVFGVTYWLLSRDPKQEVWN